MEHKIIIVDDHQMFRNGLKVLIEMGKLGTVIAEAENGKQFLELLDNHHPDIVLMDIDMPVMNGIEATKEALSRNPDLKIMALSMHGSKNFYVQMIEAGAKGFIMKRSGKDELEKGITDLINGESFFSNELLRNIVVDFGLQKVANKENSNESISFNEREMEVLKLLCNGLSSDEIADKIALSKRTINTYRSKLLSKTGTKNTVDLVIFAIKNNLVKI